MVAKCFFCFFLVCFLCTYHIWSHTTGGCEYLSNFCHYMRSWPWMSYMVCVCNTRLVVALYVVMVMNELYGLCIQHTAGGCIIRGHGHEWVIWFVYATHGWWLHYTWAWSWMSYMVCVCNTRLVVALYVVMVMNELYGLCIQHTAGGCIIRGHGHEWVTWFVYATHGWWLHYTWSWSWMSYMVCVYNTRLVVALYVVMVMNELYGLCMQHTAGGCIIRGHGHEWVIWFVYTTHGWWLHYTWSWPWMSYMVCVCNTRLVVALYVVMAMNELYGLCMQHTAGGCIIRGHGHEWVIWFVYTTHGWWLQIYLCTKSVHVVMVIDELHGSYMYAILSSLTRFKCWTRLDLYPQTRCVDTNLTALPLYHIILNYITGNRCILVGLSVLISPYICAQHIC